VQEAGRLYALELKRLSGEERNRDGCIGGERKMRGIVFSLRLSCRQKPGWDIKPEV